MTKENNLDAAQVGKMFVTAVSFQYHAKEAGAYDNKANKYKEIPARWDISATLQESPERYGNKQTMTIQLEQGIGQKLAEFLLPVIIADASRKAQQLADDSKAMLAVLGERTIACIANP
jgi:hypothetical protein